MIHEPGFQPGFARRLPLGLAALALLFAWAAAAAAVGLVALAGWFLTASALAGLGSLPGFSWVFASAGVRALAVLRALMRYGERLVGHQATLLFLSRLRTVVLAELLALPPARLLEENTGDLLQRALTDVDALELIPLRIVLPAASGLLTGVAGTLLIGLRAPELGVAAAFGFVLIGLIIPLALARLGHDAGARLTEARADLRAHLVEAFEGWPELYAYAAAARVGNRLANLAAATNASRLAIRRVQAHGPALASLAAGGTTLLMLGLGAELCATGKISGPLLAGLVLGVAGLLESVDALPAASGQLGAALASARRLQVLRTTSLAERGTAPFPIGAPLRLCDVVASYGGNPVPGIDGLRAVIRRGTFAVITGPSGSGKSTLLALLARELDPSRGALYLGATPLSHIDQMAFTQHVTLVGQDEHIFDGSVRENLTLAAHHASDDALWRALDAVGLGTLVREMDGGLDAPVGPRGARLSGGQCRRLAVARAVLRSPTLLLMDEPTAGLDRAGSQSLIRGIRATLPAATIVVATHDGDMAALADMRMDLSTAGDTRA